MNSYNNLNQRISTDYYPPDVNGIGSNRINYNPYQQPAFDGTNSRDPRQPVSYEYIGQPPQNNSNLQNYSYQNPNLQGIPNSYQLNQNNQPILQRQAYQV